MIRRIWLLLVVILAGLAIPAEAQAPLRWRFRAGDTFYQETVATMKQAITYSGQTINQDWEQVTISRFLVKQAIPESNSTVLNQTIEAVRMSGTGQVPGAAKALEAMQGATFEITLRADNQITSFDGYEEFLKKAGGEDPQVGRRLLLAESQGTAKKAIEESFIFLPERMVMGEPWKRDFAISCGPLGTINATHTYVYEGNESRGGKSLAKIGVTATVTYQAPKGEAASGLGFQITKGELKADNAKGTIWFDPQLGRLAESEMKMHLRGNLTISANGQDYPMTMDQDQNVRIRITKDPPAPVK